MSSNERLIPGTLPMRILMNHYRMLNQYTEENKDKLNQTRSDNGEIGAENKL